MVKKISASIALICLSSLTSIFKMVQAQAYDEYTMVGFRNPSSTTLYRISSVHSYATITNTEIENCEGINDYNQRLSDYTTIAHNSQALYDEKYTSIVQRLDRLNSDATDTAFDCRISLKVY